jgi:hypothetical protein
MFEARICPRALVVRSISTAYPQGRFSGCSSVHMILLRNRPQTRKSRRWLETATGRADLSLRRPARPRWCDQITTSAENQLHPYSEHSCAPWRSHGFVKLRASTTEPGVVMGIVPLEIQRRSERRWAARFARPTESLAHRDPLPEMESQVAGPEESEEESPPG